MFKHFNSEVGLDFEVFKFLIHSFFQFVTFHWKFFPVDWEKKILFSIGNITQYRL